MLDKAMNTTKEDVTHLFIERLKHHCEDKQPGVKIVQHKKGDKHDLQELSGTLIATTERFSTKSDTPFVLDLIAERSANDLLTKYTEDPDNCTIYIGSEACLATHTEEQGENTIYTFVIAFNAEVVTDKH